MLYLGGETMPVISMFYGIIIYMYFKDYNPPHIHTKYQGKNALISLDGEVLEGELPRKQLKLVDAWIELHKDEIIANWELAQSKQALYKIDPLK